MEGKQSPAKGERRRAQGMKAGMHKAAGKPKRLKLRGWEGGKLGKEGERPKVKANGLIQSKRMFKWILLSSSINQSIKIFKICHL
jgi:hypothetical protein